MLISINKIWSILSKRENLQVIALFILMLIGAFLEMLGIGLVIPVVTVLMQEDIVIKYPQINSFINILGNPSQTLITIYSMIGLLCVYMIKNFYLAFLVWRQRYFAYCVRTDLGRRLFSNYLYQPYSFHQRNNSAQLIRNISGEVSILISYGINSILIIATEAMVVLGILVMLITIEPLGAAIVVLLVGPLSFVFYGLFRSKVARWGKARQIHDGLLLQNLQQGLGGVKDTKVIGCEETFVDEYDFHNKKSSKIAQWEQTLQALPRLWIELICLVTLALLVTSLSLGNERSANEILPILGFFAAAAFRLMPSFSRVISALHGFQFSKPVIDVIVKEIKLDKEIQTLSPGSRIYDFKKDIVLDNINFTYESTKVKILDGLTLKIKHNQSIGLIGKSGAGKSTIADIILGLLSPEAGQVLVDGRNIQDDILGWRSQIGYVPQVVFLTDGTLKSNVAFGMKVDDIDEEAVRLAIKSAQLEQFIEELPNGMETVIGERGVRLSGGQRQRVGIARALYHNPAVLVLDEATSSLDVKTESGFIETISNLHGKRTLIIIAHRLSTIKHCDLVYRLENGKLVHNKIENNIN
ncbi:ABC transporter ATP-binding protein/permease [Alphaproteobacteria bacterium]|nr:ABC transporter ATP-binding protein/permease [Alphaproteobacteria bacterium]MDC1085887.1 ABC transporter ATP-binding protein [Alphaproteobacteria bacterium]